MNCCGISNYTDWFDDNNVTSKWEEGEFFQTVPESCCIQKKGCRFEGPFPETAVDLKSQVIVVSFSLLYSSRYSLWKPCWYLFKIISTSLINMIVLSHFSVGHGNMLPKRLCLCDKFCGLSAFVNSYLPYFTSNPDKWCIFAICTTSWF